jgi:transcriptional regulator with XRE-family HTH domain
MLRKKMGFSMQELGAKAGVSPATINTVERYSHFPGDDTRSRIAKALGVAEVFIWPSLLEENGDGERN